MNYTQYPLQCTTLINMSNLYKWNHFDFELNHLKWHYNCAWELAYSMTSNASEISFQIIISYLHTPVRPQPNEIATFFRLSISFMLVSRDSWCLFLLLAYEFCCSKTIWQNFLSMLCQENYLQFPRNIEKCPVCPPNYLCERIMCLQIMNWFKWLCVSNMKRFEIE